MSADLEPKQIPVSEKDVALIKQTFTEDLLKTIRALFFGLEISSEEAATIKDVFAQPDLIKMMWRRFCPSIDRNSPIGQISDEWLGTEKMVFGQHPDAIYQAVHYKDEAIKMTKKALALLVNPDGEKVSLAYSPNGFGETDTSEVKLLARNQFMQHIEQQLYFLLLIATQKVDTPEETKKKALKNSSQ